jgi:hypothetical protein
LAINAVTGVITGIPTTIGSFTASVVATGSGGAGVAEPVDFTLTEGIPIITAGQSFSAILGAAANIVIALTDSNNRPATSWSVTGLPSWATLDTTGIIKGTPTSVGSYPLSITAVGPGGSATIGSILVVYEISVVPGQRFAGKEGVAFSATPALNGVAASWAATGLPTGLSINSASGNISGTPTSQGEFIASVSVTSAGGGVSSPVAVAFVIADPRSSSSFVPLNLYSGRAEVVEAQMLDEGGSVATRFYTSKRFNGQYFVNARFKGVGALPVGISWESDSSGIHFYGVPQQIGNFEALFEGPYPDNFQGTTTRGNSSIVCGGAASNGLQTIGVVGWVVKFNVSRRTGGSVTFGQAYRTLLLQGREDFTTYREKWTLAVAATIPGPPLIGSVAHGNGQITIYFSAPLSDGGDRKSVV